MGAHKITARYSNSNARHNNNISKKNKELKNIYIQTAETEEKKKKNKRNNWLSR